MKQFLKPEKIGVIMIKTEAQEMVTKNIVVILTEDLNENLRSQSGLYYAMNSAVNGNNVSVILFGNSVLNAKKDNCECSSPDESTKVILEEINDVGGRIYASNVFCKKANIQQTDLLRFVEIEKLRNLTELINTADIQLTF